MHFIFQRRQPLVSYEERIDSKFRYVIIASKRAKQLLKGAKPKVKTRSRNLIRIAQEEVNRGLIQYEIRVLQEEEQDEKKELFLADELFGAEGSKAGGEENKEKKSS